MNIPKFILKAIASASLVSAIMVSSAYAADAQDKTVRIGFQKYGKLVLLKSKGTRGLGLIPKPIVVSLFARKSGS